MAMREEYRALLAQNVDPQLHKQENAQIHSIANTFYSVAEKWLEKRSKEVESLTMKKNWERLENHLFPRIGNYPIDRITSPILIKAVEPLDLSGKNDTLNRVINLANQILNYAVTLGYLPFNPCMLAGNAYHKEAQKYHPASSILNCQSYWQILNNHLAICSLNTSFAGNYFQCFAQQMRLA